MKCSGRLIALLAGRLISLAAGLLFDWRLLAAGIITLSSTLEAQEKPRAGAILNPQRDFKPQCVTLGQPGQGVFDGEVLSDPPAMVFSDSAAGGSMWVARLDPKTGLFVTPTGRDQLVASDVTPLFRIFNGGE